MRYQVVVHRQSPDRYMELKEVVDSLDLAYGKVFRWLAQTGEEFQVFSLDGPTMENARIIDTWRVIFIDAKERLFIGIEELPN